MSVGKYAAVFELCVSACAQSITVNGTPSTDVVDGVVETWQPSTVPLMVEFRQVITDIEKGDTKASEYETYGSWRNLGRGSDGPSYGSAFHLP